MEEIKRILFTRRQIIILVGLLVYSLFTLNSKLSRSQEYQGEYLEYVETYKDRELTDIMKELNEISNNGSMLGSVGLSEIYHNVEYLLGFEKNIENIQKQAETMGSVSIFAGSEFAKTNIRKTAADYSRLKGIEITLGNNYAVESIFIYGRSSTTYLIVYMILVVYQFIKERKRGLWNMVCASPNGRFRLMLSRFATVVIAAVGSTLILTGCEFGMAYYYCGGLNELGRMVQSVQELSTLTIPMTIGQFWLYYTAFRVMGVFFIGIVAWFLLELIADYRLVPMVWALVLGIEYALQEILAENTILYQVNLFTYMDPRNLARDYMNLNIFGEAISHKIVVLVVAGIITVITFIVGTIIYQKRKPISGYAWVDKIIDKTGRLFAPLSYHVSLLRHEQYKMLITGKGIIIIGCAWLVANSITGTVGYSSHTDEQSALESYYRQSQGKIGQETTDYIAKKNKTFEEQTIARDALQEQVTNGEIDFATYQSLAREYENLDMQKEEFAKFEAHIAELQNVKNGYVLPHWVYENLFAYNDPYSTAARKNGEETQSLMFVSIIAMCLILLIQLGVEKKTGMDKTQNSSPKGRKYLVIRKHMAAWTLAIILSVGIWGIYTKAIMDAFYGKLPFWQSPACCLSFLADVPQWISVLGYWILVVIGRTLILCAISSGVFILTELTKKKP